MICHNWLKIFNLDKTWITFYVLKKYAYIFVDRNEYRMRLSTLASESLGTMAGYFRLYTVYTISTEMLDEFFLNFNDVMNIFLFIFFSEDLVAGTIKSQQ